MHFPAEAVEWWHAKCPSIQSSAGIVGVPCMKSVGARTSRKTFHASQIPNDVLVSKVPHSTPALIGRSLRIPTKYDIFASMRKVQRSKALWGAITHIRQQDSVQMAVFVNSCARVFPKFKTCAKTCANLAPPSPGCSQGLANGPQEIRKETRKERRGGYERRHMKPEDQ
jgi:hypothetical protein